MKAKAKIVVPLKVGILHPTTGGNDRMRHEGFRLQSRELQPIPQTRVTHNGWTKPSGLVRPKVG